MVLSTIIFLHVFAGLSALITGAIAMLLKAQTPKHRIAGKVYFWNMTFIFVSGLGLAVYRSNLFFIFISFFVYHTLITAYRALKLKDLHKEQEPERIDWAIEIVAGIANFCFVLFSLYWFWIGRGSDALIPMVFGMIGIRSVYKNIKRFQNRPNDPTHWLQTHISGMVGSYIGAITAFLVNQSAHIPIPNVVLWLAPTAILTPFIILEVRKVKAKK